MRLNEIVVNAEFSREQLVKLMLDGINELANQTPGIPEIPISVLEIMRHPSYGLGSAQTGYAPTGFTKIAAIKEMRSIRGIGLREAKDAIDFLEVILHPETADDFRKVQADAGRLRPDNEPIPDWKAVEQLRHNGYLVIPVKDGTDTRDPRPVDLLKAALELYNESIPADGHDYGCLQQDPRNPCTCISYEVRELLDRIKQLYKH